MDQDAPARIHSALTLLTAPPTSADWQKLIFGSFSREEIRDAVQNGDWQMLRMSLMGTSMLTKYKALLEYLAIDDWTDVPDAVREYRAKVRRVQVTNYVNALKRGGLIK